MSNASEQANGRASGPVLQSVFLAVIDHSAWMEAGWPDPHSFLFSVHLGQIERFDVSPGVIVRDHDRIKVGPEISVSKSWNLQPFLGLNGFNQSSRFS